MLWYSLEVPCWGTSNEYPQDMFSWRNQKNINTVMIEKSALYGDLNFLYIFEYKWVYIFMLCFLPKSTDILIFCTKSCAVGYLKQVSFHICPKYFLGLGTAFWKCTPVYRGTHPCTTVHTAVYCRIQTPSVCTFICSILVQFYKKCLLET